MRNHLVATIKPWNIWNFEKRFGSEAAWHLITEPDGLEFEAIKALDPRYIFFPHWSWRVPAKIHQAFECVCFHMTDVPYGRGGSPLQNLILRGRTETKLTALRMVDALDAGPVYLQRPLSLDGSAEEIFERASALAFEMMVEIAAKEPAPWPQKGDPVFFERRRPEQSHLPESGELTQIFDHIRMLDAPGYPHAFLDHGAFRLEFRNAERDRDSLTATVTIRKRG